MATSQFTDDAYNKFTDKTQAKTLIANWFEEDVIREETGEGRCINQRHIKRSGLLKDFTKLPSQLRKLDDTFKRVYGQRDSNAKAGVEGTEHISLPDHGDRWHSHYAKAADFAKDEREKLDEAEELKQQARDFCTSNVDRDVACPAPTCKAEKLRDSSSLEIKHGPPGPKEDTYCNRGMDARTHLDYANQVPVTFYTQIAASTDAHVQSSVKVTVPSGASSFGKNADFSQPVSLAMGGRFKDYEMDEKLKATKASGKHPNGTVGLNKSNPDSLAHLKVSILEALREKYGILGFPTMRRDLSAKAKDGYIPMEELKKYIIGFFSDIDALRLDIFLKGLATMKKDSVQLVQFYLSLTAGSVPNEIRLRLLEAYRAEWRPTEEQFKLLDEIPNEQEPFISFFGELYVVSPTEVEKMVP